MTRLAAAPTLIVVLLAIGFLVEYWPIAVALCFVIIVSIGIYIALEVKRRKDQEAHKRLKYREAIVQRNREAVALAKKRRLSPKRKHRQN